MVVECVARERCGYWGCCDVLLYVLRAHMHVMHASLACVSVPPSEWSSISRVWLLAFGSKRQRSVALATKHNASLTLDGVSMRRWWLVLKFRTRGSRPVIDGEFTPLPFSKHASILRSKRRRSCVALCPSNLKPDSPRFSGQLAPQSMGHPGVQQGQNLHPGSIQRCQGCCRLDQVTLDRVSGFLRGLGWAGGVVEDT